MGGGQSPADGAVSRLIDLVALQGKRAMEASGSREEVEEGVGGWERQARTGEGRSESSLSATPSSAMRRTAKRLHIKAPPSTALPPAPPPPCP